MSVDKHWMNEAYKLAIKARQQGEVPVGAVVVNEENKVVGTGWNQVIQTNNPTAHAEILAIQAASRTLNNYRLTQVTLYVTLEPCCMCAGAMVHARIKRLVFATRDFKTGAAGSVCNLLHGLGLNHQVVIDEGILQSQCAELLTQFFSQMRSFPSR